MINFEQLFSTITQVHQHLQSVAANAVNRSLTIRNWLIALYIVEFEQHGGDRAKYGDNLLENIATQLNIKGLADPELSRCRQFYQVYPQILGTLSQELRGRFRKQLLGHCPKHSIHYLHNPKNLYKCHPKRAYKCF